MQSKRDVLNSAKLREKKRKVRKRRLVFCAAVVVVLCIGFVLTARLDYFTIKGIVLEKNIVTDADAVHSAVAEHIEGNYFLFIPKNNFLLYPKRAIIRDIHARFPRISQASVSRVHTDQIAVEIKEYTPAYLWCGDLSPQAGAPEDCYFLDADGYVFSRAPYFSGDAYFKFYGGLTPGTPVVGSHFLDASRIGTLFAMGQSFRDLGFEPYGLFVDTKGEYELLVVSPGKASHEYPRIRFRSTASPDVILSNLTLALATEPLASKIEFAADSLEYIDLRYDNKVYYKFIGE